VTINEFPVPTANSSPQGITVGPDGNLWFAEPTASQIGQINPTTHAALEFPIPGTTGNNPAEITAGPDGNLWFAENNHVGQINPTTHAIAQFSLPTAEGACGGITAGPDGNIWFTEFSAGQIGVINPTTDLISEFFIPSVVQSLPSGITRGPDGNIWFADFGTNQIGQINPTTHAISQFTIPTASSGPLEITPGPDGNLWFTETAGRIGRINPVTHTITEFAVPTAGSEPIGIASGPDGSLWFTDAQKDQIGTIDPTTHNVTLFPIPTPNSRPADIVSGPDGNLWFTEERGNKIGQVVVTATSPAPDLALSGSAPRSVPLGEHVTYTLTLTNDGTAGATGVVLRDTLPADATFISDTGGVTPAGGVLTFTIGNLAAGASVRLSVVVASTVPDVLVNQAGASMNQTDPTPADNSLTQVTTVTPAVVDGPRVIAVQLFRSHSRQTLVLTFDSQLDSDRAQNTANYRIDALGKPRHTIRIKLAVYDSAARTVTLTPLHRLKLHHRFRLTVVGTPPGGLTDTSGHLLDGLSNGAPGHDFVTIVTERKLVSPSIHPARGSSATSIDSVARLHL
jgi:uncharacterized repeat protein (TIGR01451 family)